MSVLFQIVVAKARFKGELNFCNGYLSLLYIFLVETFRGNTVYKPEIPPFFSFNRSRLNLIAFFRRPRFIFL